MKKLTINRVASAGLKAGRRGYLSLAAGIFLAIFLVSSLCLAAQCHKTSTTNHCSCHNTG